MASGPVLGTDDDCRCRATGTFVAAGAPPGGQSMSAQAEDRTDPVPYPWADIDGQPKPSKRIWVPHVDSELRSLWVRVDMAQARLQDAWRSTPDAVTPDVAEWHKTWDS